MLGVCRAADVHGIHCHSEHGSARCQSGANRPGATGDEWNVRRTKIANAYLSALGDESPSPLRGEGWGEVGSALYTPRRR